jgi:hypothetical protein
MRVAPTTIGATVFGSAKSSDIGATLQYFAFVQ